MSVLVICEISEALIACDEKKMTKDKVVSFLPANDVH